VQRHPSVHPDRSSPHCASALPRDPLVPFPSADRSQHSTNESAERLVQRHPSVHPDRSSPHCASALPRDPLVPFPSADRSQHSANENAERLARHRSVRPDRSRGSVDLNPARANAARLARRPNVRPRHRQDCVNAARKDRPPDHSRVRASGPPPAQPLCILPGHNQDRVSADPEVAVSNAVSSRVREP